MPSCWRYDESNEPLCFPAKDLPGLIPLDRPSPDLGEDSRQSLSIAAPPISYEITFYAPGGTFKLENGTYNVTYKEGLTLGILADISSKHRQLTQETLYRLKKMELENRRRNDKSI